MLERCHAKAPMTAQPTILISYFGSNHPNDAGCLHRVLCSRRVSSEINSRCNMPLHNQCTGWHDTVWENDDASTHSEVICNNGSDESFSKHDPDAPVGLGSLDLLFFCRPGRSQPISSLGPWAAMSRCTL
ncbi:hypothetical protein TNCV_3082161 [Trichonephila clavipes]|nr:hypothetical protein TNCV_3082161 [Trichonephila clavipes]